jgi:hypothetical protein
VVTLWIEGVARGLEFWLIFGWRVLVKVVGEAGIGGSGCGGLVAEDVIGWGCFIHCSIFISYQIFHNNSIDLLNMVYILLGFSVLSCQCLPLCRSSIIILQLQGPS